jgi:hypothetical protein
LRREDTRAEPGVGWAECALVFAASGFMLSLGLRDRREPPARPAIWYRDREASCGALGSSALLARESVVAVGK